MKLLTLILSIFLIFGCSPKSLSPIAVSDDFWTAQKHENIQRAKSFTVKEDTKKTTLYQKIKIKAVDFGETKKSENQAEVATKLYLKGDKDINEVNFLTKLNKTDKGWKVNMSETKKSLYFAISKQVAGNFGKMLKDELGSIDGIKDIFGDIFEGFKQIIDKSQTK